MRKKSNSEMRRQSIAKATRTLIRLKHSLAADEEINATLPETLDEFDEALARRELKGLVVDVSDALGGGNASGD
jgi:hypothetical protein